MIGQCGCHPWGALTPLGANHSRASAWGLKQGQAQTHMGAGEVIEGLKEDHPTAQLLALLTETPTLSPQRGQVLTQGEVEPFDQTGTDRQPHLGQALGAAHDAVLQGFKPAFDFVLDDLSIHQVGVGFQDGLPGPPRLARTSKFLNLVVAGHQNGQITTQAVTEKAGYAHHYGRSHLHQAQRTGQGAGTDNSSQHHSKLRSVADPDPLAPLFTAIWAFATGISLGGVLAGDEAPHLVKLHLGDTKFPQQMFVNLLSLVGGTPQPLQHCLLGDSQHKADTRKIYFHHHHLQGHHHLLFGRAQVKKHCVACQGVSGLGRSSDILVDQLKAIDNHRLRRRLGSLPDPYLSELRHKLLLILDFVEESRASF